MSQVTIIHPVTGQSAQVTAALLPAAAKLAAARIADAHSKIAHYAKCNAADKLDAERARLDVLLASQASINAALES